VNAGISIRPRLDLHLREDDAGGSVVRGQLVDLSPVGQPGASLDLAVDRDHGPGSASWRRRGGGVFTQPTGQYRRQHVGVYPHQQPPYGRGRRNPAIESEPGPRGRVQIGSPVDDRGERGRAGQHRAHRHGEQAGEGVTHPTRVTRVRHGGQDCQQPASLTVGDGVR
jgi:hypothetical protein